MLNFKDQFESMLQVTKDNALDDIKTDTKVAVAHRELSELANDIECTITICYKYFGTYSDETEMLFNRYRQFCQNTNSILANTDVSERTKIKWVCNIIEMLLTY